MARGKDERDNPKRKPTPYNPPYEYPGYPKPTPPAPKPEEPPYKPDYEPKTKPTYPKPKK